MIIFIDDLLSNPVIILFVLAFILILMSLISLIKAYKLDKNRTEFWSKLGGNLLTISSILIATGMLLITFYSKKTEVDERKNLVFREKFIKEVVKWDANITHIPSSKSLDIKIICNKTAETLEPKNVDVTVEVVYRDAFHMPTKFPVKYKFYDVTFKRVESNSLVWEAGPIKNIWPNFKDNRDLVADIEVLSRPISVNLDIKYNLDMQAAAEAPLFPDDGITNEYYNNGLRKIVSFIQIIPQIRSYNKSEN